MLRIILLLSMLITATNASFAGNPLSDFGNWITGRGSDLIPQGPELPNGGAGNWSLPPPSPPGQISCETIYSPFSGHNEYVDQRATEAYCNPTPKSASTSNEPVKLNKDVTDPSNFVKLTPPEPPQPAPEPDPQYDPYDATNTFDPAETSLAQPTYEAPSTPQYQHQPLPPKTIRSVKKSLMHLLPRNPVRPSWATCNN